jgi:hypothetical protein
MLGGGLIAMDCLVCGSTTVTERPDVTARGYRRFRCNRDGNLIDTVLSATRDMFFRSARSVPATTMIE